MSKKKLKTTTSLTSPQDDPLKRDFRLFLYLIWKHLGLPDPTPVQYDIAYFLQHGPRRKVIMAFRGVGKSWITAAYAIWLLYCDPQTRIMVVSASKPRADDFSTFIMQLIQDMELLAHLRPTDDQRQSKLSFDVRPAKPDHAPSFKSAGITGQITGSRANHIIADDIEVPGNSDTEAARQRLAELVKEFDAIIKPGGTITYLGTPQTEMSLYRQLPERGYVVRVWPARIPDNPDKYGTSLAPFVRKLINKKGYKVGQPVDAARFSNEDLAEREMSYGRSGFALQFQLDTSLSDAERYPLKISDLIVMNLNPRKGPVDVIWARSPELVWNDLPNVALEGDRFYRPMWMPDEFADYTGSVMYVDPSGRGKDETAIAVVKMLNGRLFCTYSAGFRDGYSDDTLLKILLIAKDQQVNEIVVEPNYGDGMFAKLLMAKAIEIYPVRIVDAEWQRTQKEARIIDVLEPVMNQHRLVIDAGLIDYDYRSTENYPIDQQNQYRLIYQMTRLTRERGALMVDDRIEALAGAVKYWLDHMSRNTALAAQQHREKMLDQELRRFMKHVVGNRAINTQTNNIQRSLKCLRGVR